MTVAALRDTLRTARNHVAWRIWVLMLAVAPSTVFGAAPSERDAKKGNPRLESMQIEIWPEFDRPASVLVVMKGQIAADVRLPAPVTLRIPASSGNTAVVAYSSSARGNLLNLSHERREEGPSIALKFDAPERFFHIEFYDPLATPAPGRGYTYLWTGELAADHLRVAVQEPATVSDLAVEPILGEVRKGEDGLRYLSADLGKFQAGKQLAVKIRYTKADPRTSADIAKPKGQDALQLPVAGPSADLGAGPGKTELAIALFAGFLGLGLLIWMAMTWWYGRQSEASTAARSGEVCPKCRARSAKGDRFCSKCGAALA